MKVSLVVASGAHEGRVIPITGPQFLIGRDQQCHLRPASQAISKLHCAITVRAGQVFVKDFGSTNGTMVNNAIVQDAEVAVEEGAAIRVGPLDFTLKIEKITPKDGTPFPSESPETLAAVTAAKAAATQAPPRDTTPSPVKQPATTLSQPGIKPPQKLASNPGVKSPLKPGTGTAKPLTPTTPAAPATPTTAASSQPAANKPSAVEMPALNASTAPVKPSTATSESVSEEDERIAAMLLGMDDSGNGAVPDGSTVMDIPSPLASGDTAEIKKGEEKKDDQPKKAQTREEMSSAANDLLRKYMRRPK